MQFIKIKTGYKADQQYSISVEEAPKAYFLFLNPDQRGVFSNGLALQGRDIKGIEPDYNASLGINPLHELDIRDWVEIRKLGLKEHLDESLGTARLIASDYPSLISAPLSEAVKQLPVRALPIVSSEALELADKMRIK